MIRDDNPMASKFTFLVEVDGRNTEVKIDGKFNIIGELQVLYAYMKVFRLTPRDVLKQLSIRAEELEPMVSDTRGLHED